MSILSVMLILQVLVLGVMALILVAYHRVALAFKKSAMQRLGDQSFVRLDVEGLTADPGIAGFTFKSDSLVLFARPGSGEQI